MTRSLLAAMDHAVSALDAYPSRDVTIVHHNDTDGLTSGAILLDAFRQRDYEVTRFALEKPYPEIVSALLEGRDRVVVFADFAGKIAPMIARENGGRNLVVIIDHHPAVASDDSSVFNLDGDLFGLKGDRDISGSVTCFLFARRFLESAGKPVDHLTHLGVLGAIGDGFFVDGALSGINRDLFEAARSLGLMDADKTATGEVYSIRLGDTVHPANEVCGILDTLGGVGYYDNGSSRGIEACTSGITAGIAAEARELATVRERLFSAEIARLEGGLRTTDHIQWFDLEERFRPMGVKMVGVFCMAIREMGFLDQDKYLAGFQHVPNEVPGFGSIPFNSTKISMRVSGTLTARIRSGEMPGLDTFLPAATHKLGGFADACHSLSAATTVQIGEEETLIAEAESILIERMAENG